jgi:hypothetical protein
MTPIAVATTAPAKIAGQSTRVSLLMISFMGLAQTDERQDSQHDDDETDKIDDIAHASSLLPKGVRITRTLGAKCMLSQFVPCNA